MKPGFPARPVAERFWEKVDRRGPDECWPWLGRSNWPETTPDHVAYGYFDEAAGIAPIGAHRMAFRLAKGPIPKGKKVLHTCDFGLCCNPGHLYAGTDKDNAQDCLSRGRRRIGSRRPDAKLNEEKVSLLLSMRRAGAEPRILAKKFEVSVWTIWSVLKGQSWKHVPRALLEKGLKP